jgi:primosomal protein N' (replication factor Y)
MKVAVLIPKVFNYPFTYNSELETPLKPGEFVVVPFGKQEEIGVIWDKIEPTQKKIKIRNIKHKIENYSIDKKLIKFINWFSSYNLASKGMVLKMCLGDKKNLLKKEELGTKQNILKKNLFSLNLSQKNSLNYLRTFGNTFNVSVIQGITGSGKTLVYFERIKEIINNKKQALVLLPEIFLTNQFKYRFIEYFGFEPAIWHSKVTPKNKRKIWQGVIKEKVNLVVGARSSLFLPFKKLGIIIVDEEHDTSYKQDEGLIYNGRDMAISRASSENIPICLVTSIPSLETFNNIKNKKYNITRLKNRYSDFPLPETKIINLNFSKLKKNEYIASETMSLVSDYLKRNEQILFFLNRRGYAPFMICRNCGFKHSCPNCSIYLTFHKSINKLICHHCGFKTHKENKCKELKKNCDFNMFGPGVEKIFDELKEKYPDKNIKIFSSDFLKKKMGQKVY